MYLNVLGISRFARPFDELEQDVNSCSLSSDVKSVGGGFFFLSQAGIKMECVGVVGH